MRLSVDSGYLGTLPDGPRRSFWPPRTALQTLGVLPEHAGDAPRHSKDSPGTLLGATGRAQRVPGSILTQFWEPWSLSRDQFSSDFSNNSDDSEVRDETQEDVWKFRGIVSEVAWKLPVIAMLHALSYWISLCVQPMMDTSRKTLVISGAAMHEGSSYRAICTMEL